MVLSGGLITLFFGSILASTVLPGGVEGLLYFMVRDGHYSYTELLLTASIGNTIGGILTWLVGFGIIVVLKTVVGGPP